MKLLTFHYEMTLAKLIKKLIEESIRKDISIEYWSKRKKRRYFTILIPKQNKCI